MDCDPSGLRVLVISEGWRGSLGDSYRQAFSQLGAQVAFFDQGIVVRRHSRSLPMRAIWSKVTTLPVALEFNIRFLAFLRHLENFRPHLLFFIKGVFLFRGVLERAKRRTGAVAFHLFNDDYFHRTMSSRHAVRCIPAYDCIFTPARFNVPELWRAGARRVEFLPFGHDARFTFPMSVSPDDAATYGSDLVFLGAWRPERAAVLEGLSGVLPGKLAVWGNAWEKLRPDSPLRPHVRFRAAFCEEMSRVLSASKVALAFVTRFGPGRVIHVMRTFEIPACGAFMLAERAGGEHGEFFEDGREMISFDGPEELADKTAYYLKHEYERRRIALAGLERLRKSGYSYEDRARQALNVYAECTR